MTQRGWTWILAMLACGSFLPGCKGTVPGVNGGATATHDVDPMAVATGPSESPYGGHAMLPAVEPSPNPSAMPAASPPAGGTNTGPTSEGTLACMPNAQQPSPPEPVVPTAGPVPARTQDTALDPTPSNDSMALPPKTVVAAAKDMGVTRLPALAPTTNKTEVLPAQLPAIGPKPTGTSVRTSRDEDKAKPPPAPLVDALRCLMDRHYAEAVGALRAYDRENQEVLLLLLPLAAHLAEGKLDNGNAQDMAFYTEQLSNMLVSLRSRAALVIDKICFCRDIQGFGMYHPLSDNPIYHPGDRVDVYVEVRNFTSTKQAGANGDPVFVTRLETSAEIVARETKAKVWPAGHDRFLFQRDGPDVCQTLRHDYFDHCYFTLPETIRAGSYTLLLQVEDLPSKRVVRGSLDFSVRSRESEVRARGP